MVDKLMETFHLNAEDALWWFEAIWTGIFALPVVALIVVAVVLAH